MAYITVGEVREAIDNSRLEQIASDKGKTVDVIVTSAIDTASSIIDGKLKRVADVPLTSPPGIILEIAKFIAVHSIYQGTNDVPEHTQKGFEWADKQLDRYNRGELTLEVASDPTPGVFISSPYVSAVFSPGFIK